MESHSLGGFVSCCLECRLVVVVVFHHWLKLGAGRSLHHLMEVIEVVEVHGPMKGFGMEGVAVVVYLLVIESSSGNSFGIYLLRVKINAEGHSK